MSKFLSFSNTIYARDFLMKEGKMMAKNRNNKNNRNKNNNQQDARKDENKREENRRDNE